MERMTMKIRKSILVLAMLVASTFAMFAAGISMADAYYQKSSDSSSDTSFSRSNWTNSVGVVATASAGNDYSAVGFGKNMFCRTPNNGGGTFPGDSLLITGDSTGNGEPNARLVLKNANTQDARVNNLVLGEGGSIAIAVGGSGYLARLIGNITVAATNDCAYIMDCVDR